MAEPTRPRWPATKTLADLSERKESAIYSDPGDSRRGCLAAELLEGKQAGGRIWSDATGENANYSERRDFCLHPVQLFCSLGMWDLPLSVLEEQ